MELKKLIEDNLMISYRRFAKEIGITRPTIYNIINGKTAPAITTVKKICKYFNVNYKDYI